MIRRFAHAFALILLAAAISAVGVTHAASQRELSLEEMVDLSEEIVVGRVVSNEARWQGKLIVTVSSVEVEESIKGGTGGGAERPASNRIEITQLGGSATHPRTGLQMTMSASTQVALRPGEAVLLFVHRASANLRQLVGAQQGRFVIRENPATHEREIPVGPKQLEVTRGPGQESVKIQAVTLDTMRKRIRSHVERSTSGKVRSAS